MIWMNRERISKRDHEPVLRRQEHPGTLVDLSLQILLVRDGTMWIGPDSMDIESL